MDRTLQAAAFLACVIAVWAGWRWLRSRARPWPHAVLLTVLLASGACGVISLPPSAPTPPAVETPPVPDIAVLTVVVTPAEAVVQVGERKWTTRPEDGTIVEEFSAGTYAVTVTAPGYKPKHFDVTLTAGERKREPVVLEALPASRRWETIDTAALRKWCGSIATVTWDHQSGIRPGRTDNALFTAEYLNPVYNLEARSTMRATYKAAGYTHWTLNPIVAGGYHNYWPNTDWLSNIPEYQTRVDELWTDFVPVPFLFDDGGRWSDGSRINREAVELELTPLYSQPWFQQRFRVVTLAWEPAWSMEDIIWAGQWARRVLPSARVYLHLESGVEQPGTAADLARFGDNKGAMWREVAPHFHGFLFQDTYSFIDWPDGASRVVANAKDLARRFVSGHEGWPTHGAGGDPFDFVVLEYGSYALFHGGPGRFGTFEAAARASYELGRRLLAEVPGLAGIGDGGPCGSGPALPPAPPVTPPVVLPPAPTPKPGLPDGQQITDAVARAKALMEAAGYRFKSAAEASRDNYAHFTDADKQLGAMVTAIAVEALAQEFPDAGVGLEIYEGASGVTIPHSGSSERFSFDIVMLQRGTTGRTCDVLVAGVEPSCQWHVETDASRIPEYVRTWRAPIVGITARILAAR